MNIPVNAVTIAMPPGSAVAALRSPALVRLNASATVATVKNTPSACTSSSRSMRASRSASTTSACWATIARAASREDTRSASSSARASLSARTFSTSPPLRIPVPAAAMEINDSPMPQEPIICAPIVVAVARSPAGPVDTSSNHRSSATSPPMLIFRSAFISSRRWVKRSSVSECCKRPRESRLVTMDRTSICRL